MRRVVEVLAVDYDAMSAACHFAHDLDPGPAGVSDRDGVAVESMISRGVHGARDEATVTAETCVWMVTEFVETEIVSLEIEIENLINYHHVVVCAAGRRRHHHDHVVSSDVAIVCRRHLGVDVYGDGVCDPSL